MKFFCIFLLNLFCIVPFTSQALDQEQKNSDTHYINNKLDQQHWDEQHRQWLEQKYADETHSLEQKHQQQSVDAQRRQQNRVDNRIQERKLEDKRRDASRR